jgi:hypothetical protein
MRSSDNEHLLPLSGRGRPGSPSRCTAQVSLKTMEMREANTHMPQRAAFRALSDRYRRFSAACLMTLAAIVVGAGPAAAAPSLEYSVTADHTNLQPLQGASLKGNAYIQFTPDVPVARVSFWLDHPNPANPTGPALQLETNAPYDFRGTIKATGLALPWLTTAVTDGSHTITARATLPNGTLAPPISATFAVVNNAPTLEFQPTSRTNACRYRPAITRPSLSASAMTSRGCRSPRSAMTSTA